MKKFVFIVTVLLLFVQAGVGAADIYVLDEAGMLSAGAAYSVEGELEEISVKYGVDAMIFTEKEMRFADDGQYTAEQYYDILCGEDGILFYIAADPREYYFVTDGRGREAFTDRGVARLEREVLPYLKEDRYDEACKAFAREAEALLEMAAAGKPYNAPATKTVVYVALGVLLLPLLVAFIMTKAKSAQMKTARPDAYAANYIKDGSFRLDVSRDIYLYSTMTKTAKPKTNSSGSRGSGHGGSGGKY